MLKFPWEAQKDNKSGTASHIWRQTGLAPDRWLDRYPEQNNKKNVCSFNKMVIILVLILLLV